MMTRLIAQTLIGTWFVAALLISPASAQTAPAGAAAAQTTTTRGTVISATRTTLVVRTASGDFELFVLDNSTTRPPNIPVRSEVTVISRQVSANQTPIASIVRVTAMPPAATPQAPGTVAPPPEDPVPASVRQAESTIKRQTRRYKVGARAGVALDPELVMLGGQAQLGPFFSDSFWARPNLELGWGELTTLIALNFDALYRVPVTANTGNWALFMGGGPGLNFTTKGLDVDDDEVDTEEFNFSDFDLDVGLNLLIGIQSRGGMFLELRGTAYSQPHIRFVIGYNF